MQNKITIIPRIFLFVILALFFGFAGLYYKNQNLQQAEAEKQQEFEEKIGQMIIVGFHGTEINDKDLTELKEQIKANEVGGVVFYSYNIESKEQTKKLIKDFKALNPLYPLFFALDQEGGEIERLTEDKGFLHFPSPCQVAETKSPEQAFSLYKELAEMLKSMGFNLNFAPVVDLNINGDSPAIGKLGRSFSDNPEVVFLYAKEFIKAHKETGILTSIKHYPGHGSAENDSHLEITDVSSVWQEIELEPYKNFIEKGLAGIIMTAHIFNSNVDGNFPASLSHEHIQKNLRENLGYNGVVITDDLQMGAVNNIYNFEEIVINAVNSGSDILLFSNFFKLDKEIPWKVKKIILKAIKEGKIKEKRIQESFERIMKLKTDLNNKL